MPMPTPSMARGNLVYPGGLRHDRGRDPGAGELAMTTRPEDVIADLNDDALAEIAEEMLAEGKKLLRMAGQAAHELVKRMEQRGATVLDTDNWAGKLTPGSQRHEYDAQKMQHLQSLISEREWDSIRIFPAPRWDKRALNDLAKLGGDVRVVIEGATMTTRGEPQLELKRKEEAIA